MIFVKPAHEDDGNSNKRMLNKIKIVSLLKRSNSELIRYRVLNVIGNPEYLCELSKQGVVLLKERDLKKSVRIWRYLIQPLFAKIIKCLALFKNLI